MYYDAVVGSDCLVTFMKDEGATNSFISLGTVEKLGWKDKIEALDV